MRPAAAAAAAGLPEVLEVQCAGCGETLEVEPGLTEFICPDCATPQSLPPELLPPPPPRRKALPLPRGAADVRGARLPCGSCGALLSVPVGLPRCACPICGAELAVDTARLRHYLLSSAAAEGAIPVVPIGTSSATDPPSRGVHLWGASTAMQVQQEHPNFGNRTGLMRAESDNQLNCMEQAWTKCPNQLIPGQEEVDNPDYRIVGEEVRDVNGIVTRHSKQINEHSVGPGIVSVEKRQEEPLNHVWHQAQVQSSSYAFHPKQAHIDRVIEAQTNSITSAVFRESGCIAPSKETTATRINCTTGRPVALQTVNIEKRQLRTPNQIIQQAQKQSSYSTCPKHAQAEDADGAIHVQEKQQEHVNQANHTEEACTRLGNETIAGDSNRRRVGCSAGPDSTGVEKRKVQEANEAVKKVQKQQPNSVIHMELENQMMRVENEQLKSFSCRTRKRKKKGLIASSNSSLQLRRSKRLAKDSPASIDQEPDKNEFLNLPASPDGQASDAVMETEPIHREAVESQAVTSTGRTSATIADSESTESEPDEQPDQSLSDSPDIDKITNNLSPSSSPPYEMPQTSSNELDNLHSTMPPSASSSHLDMSNPKQFARNYIPLEVRKALAKLRSNSLFEHTMSWASSGEACLHDLTDSEGGSPWIPTRQNIGTKRNQGHVRGLTLCLKVWTLPKGVRIPVSLNSSGEPVGKEAGTLTNFLCAIARDGILAPLIHEDWRRVPKKNKDIMWLIVKSLGKRWKSWKALLKQKHYNTHETEEERLADQNPRVLKEQWQFLVAYWSTEKAKAASVRNKACQANVIATHTAGTKSFARIIEEERQKRPNKDEPTRADLFILTHTPKNGKPMKKATADIIGRLCEESHKQTDGSGSDSTARNFGLESSNGRRGKAGLKASVKEAMEAKRRAEDEAATLKKKMMAMEESQKKMQEDLANMKNTVSAIHKTMPTGHSPDKHTHNMTPVCDFSDELTGGPSLPPGFPQNPYSSPPMPGPKYTKNS